MADRKALRGILAGAAAGALVTAVLGIAATVGADGGPNITVDVNGQPVTFDSPPVMINDHVYVPIRYIATALGIPVQWDGPSETVYVGAVPETSGSVGGTFDYQNLRYATTGLVIRQYPGAQNTSASYWIVSYSITNNGTQPVNVPQQMPALQLFGPNGAQLSPDSNLSGAAPGVVNPGITFSGYLVFDVPAGALTANYALGFNTYQVAGSQFTTTPVSAALPGSSSSQMVTNVGSSYALSKVWNSDAQTLNIYRVTQSTQVVPDLSPGSFNPSTSFWVVDFGVTNPGPSSVTFSASNFALSLGDYNSIAPLGVRALPGYIAPSNLTQSGGVTLGAGDSFSGSLMFALPLGTSTTGSGLALTVNGQTRIVSIEPCSGACPPIRS